MATLPRVEALILADRVYTDAKTGGRIIAGTFNRLVNLQFPTRFTREACIYVAVTDVRGKVTFEIRFVDNRDLKVLAVTRGLEVESNDPLATVDFSIDLPQFPMPRPGTFTFDLHANGEKIGSMRLLIDAVAGQGTEQ